jgi:hypothetical protein
MEAYRRPPALRNSALIRRSFNILFGWAGEDASSVASIDLSINVEKVLFTTVQVVFSPLQRTAIGADT